MNEKQLAAFVVAICALPAIGLGIACLTDRWLPSQFAKAARAREIQSILSMNLLMIGVTIALFAGLVWQASEATLLWLTPLLAVTIKIDTLVLAF